MTKGKKRKGGWFKEPIRHGLAARGIKTGTRMGPYSINDFHTDLKRMILTYEAIDEMFRNHGMPRPDFYGGGVWDRDEELAVYVEQVGNRYSPEEWGVFMDYAKKKGFNTGRAEKELRYVEF